MSEQLYDVNVFRELSSTAYQMLFDSQANKAKRVFSALLQLKPDYRPAHIGLFMINLDQKSDNLGPEDGVKRCIRALFYLQISQKNQAVELLNQVMQSTDKDAIALAQVIKKEEIGDRF